MSEHVTVEQLHDAATFVHVMRNPLAVVPLGREIEDQIVEHGRLGVIAQACVARMVLDLYEHTIARLLADADALGAVARLVARGETVTPADLGLDASKVLGSILLELAARHEP